MTKSHKRSRFSGLPEDYTSISLEEAIELNRKLKAELAERREAREKRRTNELEQKDKEKESSMSERDKGGEGDTNANDIDNRN